MTLTTEITEVVERIATEFKTVRTEIATEIAGFTPDLSGYATTQALTDSFLTLNTKDGTMVPKYPTFPEMGAAISQVENWASENFGNVPTRDEMNVFLAERPTIDTIDGWLQAKADITYVDAQLAALGGGSGSGSGGAAIDDTVASLTTVYSSEYIGTLLAAKANSSSVYTKTQTDNLVDGNALVAAFGNAMNAAAA